MTSKKDFVQFSRSEQMMPQPEMLEIKKHRKQLSIGIPKEIAYQENRIGLIPEDVSVIVNNGHRVIVESNAGKSAHFPDNDYMEAGAELVYSSREVFQSDIIIKVAPPVSDEIEQIKARATLFSALNLPGQSEEYFKQLIAKKITAISYEHIKDKTNSYPVIRSMSEIVGNTSVFIAGEYLCSQEYGKGKSLGGFPGIAPAEVVIIGAGTVGEFAARAALGMGALVKIFDDSIYKLRSIQNKLGERLYTSVIQQKVLAKALRTADVVIGALNPVNGRTPCIITEDMVREMPFGSVIIDVSIDNGGCSETSHATNHTQPVFKKFGITHFCVPNIPSKVPHTASTALSNFFAPVILQIAEEGGIENFLRNEKSVRMGTYMFSGILTSKYISDLFHIPFQEIDLLMLPFH
ncbi:MAG TPA: alanine dehydrogenase [Bacteroidales bacterium]|nr:alanine dehydrogenase [Bacteroidales bacterium]HNZ42353.1 alanine dehydrogenase [Bacteroidales bacterium]HPB24807.1 alanine dehydrogenase [Bacteroidales bacterium]HPI29741.1 alanine dehydrogenase [Bacteroidales bacterium]HQN15664.1 alanine dehydrogenase [Bacteroidales bacterium]